MKFAASMRLTQRALSPRHMSILQPMIRPCSITSQRQARGYSTNKGNENTNNTGGGNSTNPTNGNAEANTKKQEAPAPEQTAEQKQIAKLKEELEEAKKETLIALADRQTSQRIARDDVRKAKEYGIQKFATNLFDVNDILERALESVKPETLENNPDLKNFYEGVQMTEKLLLKAYEQNDIKRFHPLGQKFDPNLHQALQEVPDPSKEPGTVCYVMKAGYQLKDRLLRAASVAVVKADPNATKAAEEPVASS
eukprot:Phypoly_transcript_13464.p1 GENE.Phypoly_transcript_13464~~Phypoly_transcript_13464.p1  ORF type:complete len:253 (+),score=55.72 Phypoly_transcript_13464:64-822(+)